MAVDQATTDLLTQMASQGGKPLHELTPNEARAFSDELSSMTPAGPEVAGVSTEKVEVENGNIDVIIIKPKTAPLGVIVYYHGGGWVIGKASGFQALGQHIATVSSCIVAMVDYRKAPEFQYPIPVNDSYSALKWVDGNMEAIAGEKLPIVVCGDSAGGNLSAVMAIKARDHNGPKIAMQALVYPVTNDDLNNSSYTDPSNQLMLSKESMIWFWDHYVPSKPDRNNVDASPLKAKDLSGLPPAIVITAGHDPLRQEGEEYAAKLIQAGVTTIFKRFDDQMHGFFTMVGMLPRSEEAVGFVAGSIKLHLQNH